MHCSFPSTVTFVGLAAYPYLMVLDKWSRDHALRNETNNTPFIQC
jgi:hypothetical protein